MKNMDLFSNVNFKRAISPYDHATGDAAVTTEIIDMQGQAGLVFAIMTGSLADTNVTFAVTLNESEDSGMSGANVVAAADTLGTAALASFIFSDDNKCFKIGYKGVKRYVTATITPTGNTGAALLCAVAVLVPRLLPAANPPA